MDIQIHALNDSNLHQATTLRDSVFKGLDMYEQRTLRASLHPDKYIVYKKLGIDHLAYWVASNPQSSDVLGLVGLYTQVDDEDGMVWLGWYCVDPQYRGHKIGSKLLEFAITEAKLQNKQYLHLYTTADDEYATARKQYEKIGFKHYDTKSSELYYKLDLSKIR
jgi:ribosomal protein S18 acetylase RimI-like enzyme